MLYLYFSAFVLLNVFVFFFRIVGWEEEEEGRGERKVEEENCLHNNQDIQELEDTKEKYSKLKVSLASLYRKLSVTLYVIIETHNGGNTTIGLHNECK